MCEIKRVTKMRLIEVPELGTVFGVVQENENGHASTQYLYVDKHFNTIEVNFTAPDGDLPTFLKMAEVLENTQPEDILTIFIDRVSEEDRWGDEGMAMRMIETSTLGLVVVGIAQVSSDGEPSISFKILSDDFKVSHVTYSLPMDATREAMEKLVKILDELTAPEVARLLSIAIGE